MGAKNIRKILIYAAFLSLAGLLLYVSFKDIEWSSFIEALKSCDFLWISASMAVSIIVCYFRAARWKLLLLPLNPRIKIREAFDGVNIGYLINFALPRAGEFARCGVIARTRKTSFEAALGSVVAERSVDMASMLLIFASLFVISWNDFGIFLNEQIINPAYSRFGESMLYIVIAMLVLLAALITAAVKFRKKLYRFRIAKKFYDIASGLKAGLYSVFRMQRKWEFLMHTVIIWICYWLMSLFTIYAFPAVGGLGGMDAVFLMIVASMGWIVPVQGGIGAYHFIVSLALSSVYGISNTDGIVYATISHTSQSITMLLCGAYSLISFAAYKNK